MVFLTSLSSGYLFEEDSLAQYLPIEGDGIRIPRWRVSTALKSADLVHKTIHFTFHHLNPVQNQRSTVNFQVFQHLLKINWFKRDSFLRSFVKSGQKCEP